jgi:hypothetical protein
MTAYHDSAYGGGHFAYNRTYARISAAVFWPKMSVDVKKFCKRATRVNVVITIISYGFPLQPVSVPTGRWDTMAMDIVGPLPVSQSGNKYILVCVDYLTRWPEAIAMPNQEAATVARAWVDHVINRWGIPKAVITDQGSNFTSALLSAVYARLGISRRSTTPYHPQANGLVERFNRTLKDMLTKVASTAKLEWDNALSYVLAAYRSYPHASTGTRLFPNARA